ncbi:MAG TPA: patatin-like phospholipase family protein [Steroidobacteraceae bacterium]|nr:patatin-like phospholipase family protein [Steroidobacteraceae bacterium]
MSAADEIEPQDIAFHVRTLNSNGEFELLSSTEVARRLRAALGERPLSILALSSGGASGAFGAGALAGWTNRGTRPEFTVVTGVSAGALVAPFAFLGPSWDAEMGAIFTTGVTDGLLQPRGLGAVFGSSVYSGEPLRRLIARYADDAMIAAVAVEAAKGRLLLVATTDFDSGEPVIWDLGSIALHGGRNANALFQSVLLASASVPGMLPPVMVKFRSQGRMRAETHVDGGVALPFFIAPAPEDLPQSTATGPQSTIVRVIVDGPLRNRPRRTHANAFSVFSRSLSAGLSHLTRTKLESTMDAVRQRGISFDYAAIPASYPLRSAFDFDPDAQRSLFEYAASCATADRLWVRVHAVTGERVVEPLPASGGPMCPADDSFIGSFAALEN